MAISEPCQECLHDHFGNIVILCPYHENEAAKREQQDARFVAVTCPIHGDYGPFDSMCASCTYEADKRARFADCDPGDCAGGTVESLKSLAREIQSTASQIRAGVFPLAMDAGTIGHEPESITQLRAAWDALPENRQRDAKLAVRERMIDYRNKPWTTTEEHVEHILTAVLDA